MKTIELLSKELIAQIAAGEVIERPGYVVKELIENSIDANATNITIDLVNSGISKIIVTDDGIGMSKEDVLESFKLHTTSKMKDSTFESIDTLGFRGEALASIASTSFLTIESKDQDAVAGSRVHIVDGYSEVTSLGMPLGTRVIVEELFYSVPARKKFLKSKRLELKHIVDIVYKQAVASPQIGFKLSNEGKTLIELPNKQTLKERVLTLFTSLHDSNLLSVQIETPHFCVSGYIILPQHQYENIPKQYLSINSRPVTNRYFQSAIKEAYGVLLSSQKEPSWFLDCTIPHEFIDVNIHPRKEQIKLLDQDNSNQILYEYIKKLLSSSSLIYHGTQTDTKQFKEKITTTYLGTNLKKDVLPWNKQLLTHLDIHEVSQIHNLYIITATSTGMLIIDQHAAHERILYEKFIQQFINQKDKRLSVSVDHPVLINLSIDIALILEERMPDLENLGFQIEPFSGNTFNVTQIPVIFQNRNIPFLLGEYLQNFATENFINTIDSGSKKLLAYLACKSAVKSGDPLTEQQMKDIILELEKIPEALTCPHGRPLKIHFSVDELAKMFKRK